MAVKTSWTAGQVLTAVDLTDTFAAKVAYPSGGTDGQALLKSGTAAAWGSAGGLVFVNKTDFSAAGAVNLNSVFTATFAFYRVLITATGSTTGQNLLMRLRASGVDASAANYNDQSIIAAGASITTNAGASQTSARIADVINSGPRSICLDIFNPQLAAPTQFAAAAAYGYTSNYTLNAGGHTLSTSYDGFSFYPTSGAITGRVITLGYALS